MLTWQDYEKAADKTKWIQESISSYLDSSEYKKAKEEEEYMAGQNTAILNTVKVIYNMAGVPETDFTASNIKIRDNTIHRLVTDRCSYSLGNGVSFPGRGRVMDGEGRSSYIDRVKDLLGPKFDRMLKRAGYWALGNGTSYLYAHMDRRGQGWKYTLFRKTGFLALYDEGTGELRGGIRFWSLDWGSRPITAVLYTQQGYIRYQTLPDEYSISALRQDGELQPYIETVATSEAYGEEVVGTEELPRLPIFPLHSGENRSSALDKLKPLIDSTDIVLSGFANDLHDVAQVYWLVSGAMGMSESDKRQFLDRILLQHMAVVDGENSSVTPYTQEIPYEAREHCLAQLRSKMYENYGGFDIHMVEAGATNDHIDAAYWPMDEEADDFEYEVIDFVQSILAMMGEEESTETTPIFKRNRVSNQREQTDMVMLAAEHLDEQTLLGKLPWISVDEIPDIMMRRELEAVAALAAANNVPQPEEEQDENPEDEEA